jgi:hypothetical protein
MQKIKPLNLKKEAAHIIPVGEEDITKVLNIHQTGRLL